MNKKMIIAIIVGVLAVTSIVFALYKASNLKTIQITKIVTIKGSEEEVFNMVKYLDNYPKWSPFLMQDPTQKYEVRGNDGTIGAQYHWNGNKGKDLGYQEIVNIEPYRFITMKCSIQKPFNAQPTFDYSFKKTSNGIEVTQNFKLESGLIDAFFIWVFGSKSEMEKTNQQGMDLLKKAVENN